MRKIMHLSDLHFGRTDASVVAGLQQSARTLEPHLVVVSGDLTQRARKSQFVAARAFLDKLPAPTLIVPGNHDVPLYDVVRRFALPLARFRQHLARDADPVFADDEMIVVGVNTARSLTFKGGRINREQVKRVVELFRAAPSDRVRILVTHHPFDIPGVLGDEHLVGRAGMAMEALRECSPDLLLSGHLHAHGIGTTTQRYDLGGRNAILAQAGTAASTRLRETPNSFNLIHIDRHRIAIDRFDWSPAARAFSAESTSRFIRSNGAWTRAEDPR